jgi:hypothetical protein
VRFLRSHPFLGLAGFTILLGNSKLTPLLGLLVGLAPYLLADWLLAKYRVRSARAV